MVYWECGLEIGRKCECSEDLNNIGLYREVCLCYELNFYLKEGKLINI